jgi:hypothetical protein
MREGGFHPSWRDRSSYKVCGYAMPDQTANRTGNAANRHGLCCSQVVDCDLALVSPSDKLVAEETRRGAASIAVSGKRLKQPKTTRRRREEKQWLMATRSHLLPINNGNILSVDELRSETTSSLTTIKNNPRGTVTSSEVRHSNGEPLVSATRYLPVTTQLRLKSDFICASHRSRRRN